MNKVAIILTNYNMPERTDAICDHLKSTVRHPADFYIVDNGSDLVDPSRHTNIFLDTNRQTTGGFLAGVDAAKSSGEEYLAYWFIITSAKFNHLNAVDPLYHLLPLFMSRPDTFAVSPAVKFPKHGAWERWMAPRELSKGGSSRRRTWGMDYISVLIDAEKYHKLGGFRPQLTYMWGVPGEMNWQARKHGWKLYINDEYIITKETDIGYEMDRMNMTAQERRENASKQCDDVLIPIYGKDFREKFRYEYLEVRVDGEY